MIELTRYLVPRFADFRKKSNFVSVLPRLISDKALQVVGWDGSVRMIPGRRALFSPIFALAFARVARPVFLARLRASGLVDQAIGQKLPPP